MNFLIPTELTTKVLQSITFFAPVRSTVAGGNESMNKPRSRRKKG